VEWWSVGAPSSRSRRDPGRKSSGRHFLSPRLAAELARAFDIGSADLVIEVGAGAGRLTRELARTGSLVLAIELDADLARDLLRSASAWPNVYVHQGDALEVALPRSPFRLAGNIPFGITTGLLRRVMDTPHAERLDLITQLEPARKRAAARGSVLSVVWSTAWRFEIRRRLSRRYFHPHPSVDAAWLVGTRRDEPLINPAERVRFERFVRRGFEAPDQPIVRALGVRAAMFGGLDIDPRARAIDLTVDEWVSVFRLLRR
jgi:23S rRNA (adenine-N6)-dimethyltransferase